MITIQLPNTTPHSRTRIAQRLEAQTADLSALPSEQSNDFCYCRLECEYTELAFAEAGGDEYKNDKSSFLFQKMVGADSIVFELYKAGALVATLNDDTLGIYYASFPAQALYTGFVIDWGLVADAHGFGVYQFKAQQTILGDASTFESRVFRLMPYADDLADGTVKIESYQNGNIIGSPFDYTDLNWYSSYRVAGRFGGKSPVIEVDNYVKSDFTKAQIQDRIRTEYTLQTRLLPSVVANAVAYDQVLANSILITDYNVLSHELYRQIQVRPISIDAKEYEQNRRMSFEIKLEAVSDLRKRNF